MENGNGNRVKIQRIWTRFPNLECGLFAALLEIERVRQHLGIKLGELKWKFMSTAQLDDPEASANQEENWEETARRKGIIYFNVGGGGKNGWDQHGRPENRSLCEICSLDLVRGAYDFLDHRPWLRDIFLRVRQNDIDGTSITSAANNLRQLMSGLTITRLDEPEAVLEFLKLGFLGVFNRCKAGVDAETAFGLEAMLIGVAEDCPGQWEWFKTLAEEAIAANEKDETDAREAVAKAERMKKTATVRHLGLFRPLRVIELRTDSTRADKVARWKCYDIIIVWRSNGHCQIFTSTPFQYGGDGKASVVAKWRVDLGEAAKQLRILEANFANPRQRLAKADWTASGYCYYESGGACPWYLAEFLVFLANGTQSSRNVPPTQIRHDKLFSEVVAILPACRLIRKQVNPGGGEGEWEHVETLRLDPAAIKSSRNQRRPDHRSGGHRRN